MKLSKKLSIFTFLLLLSVLFLAPVKANAATVGQQLTTPEEDWQRIDDSDPKIIYNGLWKKETDGSVVNAWKGTAIYCQGGSSVSLSFKFYGTKLRIIGNLYHNKRSDNIVIIDGVTETFSEYSTTSTWQPLVYEKKDLELGIHTVTIKPSPDMLTSQYLMLDAFDIDKSGYLIDFYQAPNLSAISGDAKITLNWDAVEGASNYIIKRSTVTGGPYETVGTSTTNLFTDTSLTNGIKYFYIVVPVVSGVERTSSNKASATPTADTNPDYIGNYATLVTTMTNGGIKEYSLPILDIDKFITWYDNKSDGTGKSYYTFNKLSNIVPYLRIKEYISFDKISSFEVKEFNQ